MRGNFYKKAKLFTKRLVFEWKIIFPCSENKLMSESFRINKYTSVLRFQNTKLSLPIFVYDLNSMQLLEN